MLQIKHYETLETFNNEKNNLETPWLAYVEENSTAYYSIDDITKYRILCIRQKDISNITYEAVDLGLPSGRKWADRNVGATSPEDYGSYFQWGDTNAYTYDGVGEITAVELAPLLQSLVGDSIEVTKDNVGMILEQYGITGNDLTITGIVVSLDKLFNWDSYFDTTDSGNTFNKYNIDGGLTVLESIDDAATVHMDNTWRMPNKDELYELIGNTMPTFIDLDGNEYDKQYIWDNHPIEAGKLKGIRFTGSNGNNIFIPAAGYCNDSSLYNIGRGGKLWLSNLYNYDDTRADFSYFNYTGGISGGVTQRYDGLSVRGVLKQ